MIMVCKELEKRIDNVWYRLQQLENRAPGEMSQINVDEACVARLEQTIGYLEAEATNAGYDKLAGGWIG